MAKESRATKEERVRRIISTLKTTHPDAKLALDFANPLELLVALILAAQARDDRVNEVTAELFQEYQSATDWAREEEDVLFGKLQSINFYRNKTRAIRKACQMLVDEFGGEVPSTLDELLRLPGVGRKTANVMLGNAFGQDAIGVDTHVARVSHRLGLTKQTDPDKIEADLVTVVPSEESVKFCHLLQYHGRRVCTAKSPDCPECSINELCPWPDKTTST